MEFENTSGYGIHSNVPEEIRRWNWGAFWLTWLWGAFNKSYIAFLAFVPIVNLFIPFYLGAMGNELAWRNKEWNDIEDFRKSQRNWAIGGFIFALICALSITLRIVEDNKQRNLNASVTNQIIAKIESNDRVREVIGDDYEIMHSSFVTTDISGKIVPLLHSTVIQAKGGILFIDTSLNEDYSIGKITVKLPNDENIFIE